AARLGRTSLVLLLLSAGADPAETDRDGETAVHAAARCGQAGIIKALAQASKAALGNPAAVDTPDNNGSTPLWAAAARGHLDTVEYLVGRCGASPQARDARGTTAAWMAV
ncbi:unnamed protein product, partial [Ectocarpus sp. 8 AP-2014]